MGPTVPTDVVARLRAATPDRQELVGRFMDALDAGLQWPAVNAVPARDTGGVAMCPSMADCARRIVLGGHSRCGERGLACVVAAKAGGVSREEGEEGEGGEGGKGRPGSPTSPDFGISNPFATAVGAGDVAATVASVVVKAVVAAMEATGKRLEGRVDRVLRGNGAVQEEKVELSEQEQRRIYACMLLAAKDQAGTREAPLKDVFDFYCLKDFSAGEIALRLGCSKASVINRLATLREIAGVPARYLRVYKPFFEAIEKSLTEPRARRVRRDAAAYGDDPTDGEEGG
jgi:hypothetical protein